MLTSNPLHIYLSGGLFSVLVFSHVLLGGIFCVISLFSGVQVLNFPNPLTEKEIVSSSKMNPLKGHKWNFAYYLTISFYVKPYMGAVCFP